MQHPPAATIGVVWACPDPPRFEVIHVNIAAAYVFEGWLFEVDRYHGPWPLRRKDGMPRDRAGRQFWRMISRFDALSPAEKDAHFAAGY